MKLKLTSTRPVPTANRHRLVRALASCWVANGSSLTDNDSSWTRNDSSCRHNESFSLHNNRAFSLVEVLVVVSLMSLIVLALMAVFTSTQRAFRASVTQSDVLEGSRAAMELMASDLRGMTPSYGVSNGAVNLTVGPTYYAYTPLQQSLPGNGTVLRQNLLNYFFMLGRENTKWIGVGYAVNANSSSPLFPLYRFYEETNLSVLPQVLFYDFTNAVFNSQSQWTNANLSHILDGVIHFTLRANDTNGTWMNWYYPITNAPLFLPYLPVYGETPFYMYSNTVPASVELELGVLEDRVLAHTESLPFHSVAQSNYLSGLSGNVHIFRQRVSIPNVDPTAYQ